MARRASEGMLNIMVSRKVGPSVRPTTPRAARKSVTPTRPRPRSQSNLSNSSCDEGSFDDEGQDATSQDAASPGEAPVEFAEAGLLSSITGAQPDVTMLVAELLKRVVILEETNRELRGRVTALEAERASWIGQNTLSSKPSTFLDSVSDQATMQRLDAVESAVSLRSP